LGSESAGDGHVDLIFAQPGVELEIEVNTSGKKSVHNWFFILTFGFSTVSTFFMFLVLDGLVDFLA
jgi:hypothetical protein